LRIIRFTLGLLGLVWLLGLLRFDLTVKWVITRFRAIRLIRPAGLPLCDTLGLLGPLGLTSRGSLGYYSNWVYLELIIFTLKASD
jgi:hypothetical protein